MRTEFQDPHRTLQRVLCEKCVSERKNGSSIEIHMQPCASSSLSVSSLFPLLLLLLSVHRVTPSLAFSFPPPHYMTHECVVLLLLVNSVRKRCSKVSISLLASHCSCQLIIEFSEAMSAARNPLDYPEREKREHF